jgi:hypothetical protein
MIGPAVIRRRRVERNIRELAGAVLGRFDGSPRSLLHETLNAIQPEPYHWVVDADRPAVQFDLTDGLSEPVLRRIMVIDALPPGWQVPLTLRSDYQRRVDWVMHRLARTDPELQESVTTVIAALLFGRLPRFGGGSNSSMIGCVWLNPKAGWTDDDWIDNIVHEYVHQCLFIEDMRAGLFTVDGEVLAQPDALVRSALLRTLRPYDRAYHSCFVSFALIQLHNRLGLQDRVEDHMDPLQQTLDGLIDKSSYLTPNGLAVLQSLCEAVDTFRNENGALHRTC